MNLIQIMSHSRLASRRYGSSDAKPLMHSDLTSLASGGKAAPLILSLCISSLVLSPLSIAAEMPIGGGESKPAEGKYDAELVKKILCASNFQSEACLKNSFQAPEVKN